MNNLTGGFAASVIDISMMCAVLSHYLLFSPGSLAAAANGGICQRRNDGAAGLACGLYISQHRGH
jgi:hypothetical protein